MVNLKASWFAEDLEQYGNTTALRLLSAHRQVINFTAEAWPHLLIVAAPGPGKGPCTIGLPEAEFFRLRAAVGTIGSGRFGKNLVSLPAGGKCIRINWRAGNRICLAPVYLGSTDCGRLKKNTEISRAVLKVMNLPTASAVLLGSAGGDRYFRSAIDLYFPRLVHALQTRDRQEFMKSCRNLIGMGRGSSPTGDDLIHGALVAFHYFDFDPEFIDALRMEVIDAAGQTNFMGRHMIETGLRGLTPEIVRGFILALAGDKTDPEDVLAASGIGSSTGYDVVIAILYFIEKLINKN